MGGSELFMGGCGLLLTFYGLVWVGLNFLWVGVVKCGSERKMIQPIIYRDN